MLSKAQVKSLDYVIKLAKQDSQTADDSEWQENSIQRKRESIRLMDATNTSSTSALDSDVCALCGQSLDRNMLKSHFSIGEFIAPFGGYDQPAQIEQIPELEYQEDEFAWAMRICLYCRSSFLTMLANWRDSRGAIKNSAGSESLQSPELLNDSIFPLKPGTSVYYQGRRAWVLDNSTSELASLRIIDPPSTDEEGSRNLTKHFEAFEIEHLKVEWGQVEQKN